MWFDDFYGHSGRVDRSCWSEKSSAASKREDQAKQLLDSFVTECSSATNCAFPITREIVPATIHLTNPCWLSFRKYALSKGCQVKRREATVQERANETRKGKMYVISATLPVHPSQAVAHAEQKKQEAQANAIKRKEREQHKAEEAARQQAVKRQKVEDAFKDVVLQGTAAPATATANTSAEQQPSVTIPADVEPQSILNYAEEVYQNRLKEIRLQINKEKREIEEKLKGKQRDLEQQALQECQQVKQAVLSSMPSSHKCSLCQKNCKFLVAECCCCREKQKQICAECLQLRVKREHKCYLCQRSWLGAGGKKSSDPSVRQGNSLAQYICSACTLKSSGDLEYTYCCEENVCSDHRLHHNCCVCSGHRALCVQCGISRCHNCGKELCQTCSYKEGCMCASKSGRRIMMEEMGEWY